MRSKVVVVLILLVSSTFECVASDRLTLKDGDVLSGELLEITEGVAVFRTTLAGRTIVSLDELRSISTDSPFRIEFSDGSTSTGFLASRKGKPVLISQNGLLERAIVLSSVTGAVQVKDGESSSLKPGVGVGLWWKSQDSDNFVPYGQLTLQRERDKYGMRSRLFWTFDQDDGLPTVLQAGSEWRLGGTDGLHSRFEFGVERDSELALDLRANLALSLGKRFWEDGSQYFEGDAGFDVALERFDADDLDFVLRGEERRVDNEELSLKLGMRYRRKLFLNTVFSEDFSLYPGVSNTGSLRARSESELLFPLASSLNLELDLTVDFDNEREFRRLNNWQTSIGAGLRWNF